MNSITDSHGLLDNLILALSWTLIHSLWLGLILASIAGIIMLGTRYSTAKLRYNLLSISVLLFAISIIACFGYELIKFNVFSDSLDFSSLNSTGNDVITESEPVSEIPQSNYLINVSEFLNKYSSWIVSVWIAVLVLRSLQLFKGLQQLKKIKTQQIVPVEEYWLTRLLYLSDKIGINKSVRLFESGVTKIPAVIGHFKPMILFPIGMMNSLSPEEVEAILIHELAHIKRSDYLVNLVQMVLEMVFFFNPALLWLSGLLHIERENCCDDIALETTTNKRNYINALVSFQEFNLNNPSLSIGFMSRKNQLLQRVKRILYNHNKTLNIMEKLSLISGLLITCIVLLSFSSKSALPPLQQFKASLFCTDTVGPIKKEEPFPNKKIISKDQNNVKQNDFSGSILTTEQGKNYRIEVENDIVKELTINDEQIAKDKIPDYKPITDKIIADSKQSIRKSERDIQESLEEIENSSKYLAESNIQADQAREEMERAQSKIERAHLQLEREMSRLDKSTPGSENVYKQLEGAKLELEEALKEMKVYGKMSPEQIEEMELSGNKMREYRNALKDYSRMEDLAKMESELNRLDVSKLRRNAERLRANAEIARDAAEREREIAERYRARAQEDLERSLYQKERVEKFKTKPFTKMRIGGHGSLQNLSLSEQIIADLVSENIITDMSDISIKLNAKSLVVNGTKQPKEVFNRFKEKYVKTKKWTFEYRNTQE